MKKIKNCLANNDYFFWKRYLNDILIKMEKLLQEKEFVYVDLHIHSNYSADSNQSLEEIIERAKNLKLDIISITDHDSIKVYDDLYNYLKDNKIDRPIIIPGIEFTIDNKDYGSQFHILQLMINPKSDEIINNVIYQEQANWIRIEKQFERLKKNKAIQHFLKKYNFNCTIEEYKEYLNKCYRPIPEYKTIMEYLQNKMKKYNITNWDILEQMKKWNNTDKCITRKKIKQDAYEKLLNKYIDNSLSEYNFRFFHCLLAVRGADDDFYPQYEIMGDLSVNNYNELKLDELNRNNITIFAHPSENKLFLLEELLKLNDNICGMELNKRCKYSDIKLFNNELKKLKMIKIIGSDSHDIDSDLYDNIDFYKFAKADFNNYIKVVKKYIDYKV